MPEVQVIQYLTSAAAFAAATPAVGTFTTSFGPKPGLVQSTGNLKWGISAFNLRSELVSMGWADGLASNFSFSNIIGNLKITQSVVSGKGYQWAV